MTIEEIEKIITELKVQKDQAVANVNRQIGAIDGQIAVYEQWKLSLNEKGVTAKD